MTLESRILAISDQFAGMTERRPYHPGYEAPAALELLRKSVPAKLDPQSFAALESLVGVFGSLTPSPDLTLEVA
jgi:HD-GYP domain-containing protein (c-di-GMP phosphodiesterase class II)